MAGRARRSHDFTEAYLTGLRPEAARYEVHDAGRPGLLIRVTPAGVKSFNVVHRVKGGRVERHTLGKFPTVTLKDARGRAKALTGKGAEGVASVTSPRKKKAETLGQLWKKFLELHAKPHKRSWETDERRYKLHLERLAEETLKTFTTEYVSALLAEIGATSGPIAANRLRALLYTMFEKGRREWGLGMPNPVHDAPRNAESPKSRYLLPDELRRFIRAAETDHDATTRDWLLMALYTGQRGGTLCRAKWADLNLKDAAWAIPADDMKAGRPLLVPLAAHVVELLRERRVLAPEDAVYVFPSSRPAGYIETPRDGFKRVLKAADVTALTRHDLRRTFATWAQDAGTPSIVLARLLGHSPVPGMAVTGLYAQTPLDVLRRWADRTVENMLKVARTAEDGKLLRFPGTAGGAA
jgi:integrase